MRIFNYANYYKAFELGVAKPNMTKITRALFEPIVSQEDVVNRNGNPYVVESKYSKAWCNQDTDIPENIKVAAGKQEIVEEIGAYFNDHIVDNLINRMQESQMYSALLNLVNNSNLQNDQKTQLKDYYSSGDRVEFLAQSFLFAVVGDNLAEDDDANEEIVDVEIRQFKQTYKKPSAIEPPSDIEDHELGYVRELYRVYHEETGEDYVRPEDLESQPKYKRDFERQRRDYYKAETIHRELRDTVQIDEEASFTVLKDEMYDGVIDTRDDDYESSFKRLTAVMKHATTVPISHNLDNITLNWVGPGEKKGVCHMLVNDGRLKWTEGAEDE